MGQVYLAHYGIYETKWAKLYSAHFVYVIIGQKVVYFILGDWGQVCLVS